MSGRVPSGGLVVRAKVESCTMERIGCKERMIAMANRYWCVTEA